VAESGRNTVAIVGIAATAAVGLAASTAGWLSARADRSSQRALARDDRVFSERATVYLDAIGFVEQQKEAFDSYASIKVGIRVPYKRDPDPRLTERLIAFGSARAVSAFNKTEERNLNLSTDVQLSNDSVGWIGKDHPEVAWSDEEFVKADQAFADQIRRFETVVHKDLAG
jgi:hypothetical protein